MPRKERDIRHSCPKCGEQITHLPANHELYSCSRCRARYMTLIDAETGTAAFVDQSYSPSPEPLGLPKGSVRALLAMMMAATFLLLVVRGHNVPSSLTLLLLTVIGFYFGFRTQSASLTDRIYDPAATREQPLRLPAGVIRTLLVLSFVVAGVTLASHGRLTSVLTHLEFFFILAGLLVGHYFGRASRGGGRRRRAMIAHVTGAVGILIAAVLMWVFLSEAFLRMPEWAVMALCGTVSFYFGSRS
jgi:hypothetical protein